MNPTSAAPSESPTILEYPKNRYVTQHEPDGDNDLWVQSITNAGEIIWEKLPSENVTQFIPQIFPDTPVEVETWTRNQSATFFWHTQNIPPNSGTVNIKLYREHYHERQFVKTIMLNLPMMNLGPNEGSYTWENVWVDESYSIDTFYIVRICWDEFDEVCGLSKGVFRIQPNIFDRTHIRGGTGVVGTRYEWERFSSEINFDPAEGEWPNSLNVFF